MTDKQWTKVQPLLKKENRGKHFNKHIAKATQNQETMIEYKYGISNNI